MTNSYGNKIQKDVQIIDKSFTYDLTNVLLTGVTGFLGSHIFYELLAEKKVKKIYCLIRKKYNVEIKDRLDKVVENYFPEFDLQEKIKQKVILIEGNFEKEKFELQDDNYNKLKNSVTTVIHSGANVSHYGKYETFYKSNVQATKNVVKFCIDSKASLAHISTVSVGGYCKYNEKHILTEKEINIDQNFRNHVYMITKYEAECEILKAIKNQKLNAKIFRLGNIMPRIRDGKFQINIHQNGFLSRLKTLSEIKATTKEIDNMEIDISPVDICAHFILQLMKKTNKNTIYHISNPNVVKVKDIINRFGITLKEVDLDTCIKLIRDLDQTLNAHLMNDLIASEYIETPFSTELTTQAIEKTGLTWPKITDTYLSNLYKLILQI